MRSLPRNSPEAASRIVALVLIADGHVCRSEIEAASDEHLQRELGLAPGGFARVIHGLCEDLWAGAYAGGSAFSGLDEETLASLMAEVDDRRLQQAVLRVAATAAAADRRLAEAEERMLAAARRYWQVADTTAQLQAA